MYFNIITMNENTQILYGWYSEKQKNSSGTVYHYIDIFNKFQIVTMVSTKRDLKFGFDDMEFVGQLKKFEKKVELNKRME